MSAHPALTSTLPPAREPARSWRSDELRLDLCGTWRLRLSPGPAWAPEDAARPELDDSGWETITVPSHWVLPPDGSRGLPIYTNIQFPIPLDPPHVPDLNPTADHRLRFTLPDEWRELPRVLLRLDGAESYAVVSLNGTEVGTFSGSRLPLELDVTQVLRPGENLLHLRVSQWSANSYLEDQDQWWLPGIFREVSLVGRPAGVIRDAWLQAGWDVATGHGTLVPQVSTDGWPVRLQVPELGVDVTWQSPDELAPIDVGAVQPWSCDTPRLHDATLSTATDSMALRLGFRSVELRGNQWLVNGLPLRLRGVNRHEFHPEQGRVFVEADARAGLELMKRHHVNAVRTSHYPPHPRLLELCDELGFWVIDECDLETHGFELDGWRGNPADEPQWRANLLDRMERMVERDKNHPSIICWSLGNECGTGANLAAMAAWTRRRDPSRPVHYESDYEGAYTDVVSRMYTPVVEMERMSAGRGTALSRRANEAARLQQRPMMLCEYAHAMGNGPGALAEYVEAFELPGWVGGFVWEWRDHGLATTSADGSAMHGHGGDFGEVVHDGSFVCDGLVLADGTPSPGLAELAAVYAPLRLEVRDDGLLLKDLRHGTDCQDVELRWEVMTDGEVLDSGSVHPGGLAAREPHTLPLPLDAHQRWQTDSWLTVTALWRPGDAPGWLRGEELVLGRVQHRLDQPLPQPAGEPGARPALPGGAPGAGGSRQVWTAPQGTGSQDVALGTARFDPRTGELVQLGGLAVAACGVELWRAPTENDRLDAFGSYEVGDYLATHGFGVPAPSSAARWRSAGLDRLQTRLLHAGLDGDAWLVRQRLLPAQGRSGVEVEQRWRLAEAPDGGHELVLELDVTPVRPLEPASTWPRVGLHLALPLGLEQASWYGHGPGEAYPDSRRAAWLGNHAMAVDELATRYAVPQETGHRPGMRRLQVTGPAGTLRLRSLAEPHPGFSLLRHDAHQLTTARHPHELPAPGHTHLYLDMAQHGLGTRSCGPDVLPQYQLWPGAHRLTVAFGVGD